MDHPRFDSSSDEEKASQRKQSVKAAFNSPFAPFVLASTSIGQEGLEFHTWGHSVIHWNLPSNPVDLEQREGRVHRYKGYAVRKNVAAEHARDVLAQVHPGSDLWPRLFEAAAQGRPQGSNDLIPYWIYEVGGGAKVERRVMATPFSRDDVKYRQLRRSPALYRLVFAQPRQQELLACLEQAAQTEGSSSRDFQWKIDLAPGPHCQNLPTVENICIVIFEILRPLIPDHLDLGIRLYETPRNFAEYPARL